MRFRRNRPDHDGPRELGAADGAQAHSAVLLDDDRRGDAREIALLQARSDVTVIDRRGSFADEAAQLLPARTADDYERAGHWAWYPWRRTLIAVPGPRTFRRLRLDRNRNKITVAEQARFGELTIGVVGLSVGHAIAHTIALEGLCGRLRLADFDAIELTNLNRIPATLFDLGVNKAVTAARRIAELDPYLPVDTFPAGLAEDTMSEFFDGLDIVIEECDSLDMKVRIREEARRRGIPVLMETSDRGLFDVERFDLDPQRPLFHGLLGDIDAQSLAGLSTTDKAPHVMRILEADNLSPRMAASMVEIDLTVKTWPQLGGDVQLGGATVAAAVRRFGRGESLPSGRIRVDLDGSLDMLAAADPHPAPAAVEAVAPASAGDQQIGDEPLIPVDALVHAVRLAPSGGNSQPWALDVHPDGLDVRLARERTSAMDVGFRGSYVGIGAGLFNAQVAAAACGTNVRITTFPVDGAVDRVARVALDRDSAPEGAATALAQLYPDMLQRVTNRNVGRRRNLSGEVRRRLDLAAATHGARLHIVADDTRLGALADVLAESDRIRYLTPRLHSEMMSELRWPTDGHRLSAGGDPDLGPGLGLDVRTLELDAVDLVKLQVARRADVMAQLTRWDGGRALGDNTRDRVNASSAIAVVTVDGDASVDYLRGGMAVEHVWIEAERCELAVQPISPVFLYARSAVELGELSAPYRDELAALQAKFAELTNLSGVEAPVLVFRLSHDAPAPTARSGRLPHRRLVSDALSGATADIRSDAHSTIAQGLSW